MDSYTLMQQRHSVRKYQNKQLDSSIVTELQKVIRTCNKESGLHIQLIQNEPRAFGQWYINWGRFTNVSNYIAIAGYESMENCMKCGYYGERIVLAAQQLGLNTCWVSGSFKPVNDAVFLNSIEKIILVIAIGYGENQGRPSKSKKAEEVTETTSQPDWYLNGVNAALLAPTALNRQNFYFSRDDHNVSCKVGNTFRDQIDLGILKYHFETVAGKENFNWID